MNKIKISTNNKEYSFTIDKIKIFFGSDYNTKYWLIRKIEQYLNKQEGTEYNNSISSNINIFIDENKLSQNSTNIVKLTPHFDFETDLKLGSKSLTLKYLESKLKDIEYEDDFSTISTQLKALGQNFIYNTSLLCQDQTKITFNINDFHQIDLIKLLEPLIMKNEYLANTYDFSYDEIIRFQIDLIKEISTNTDKNLFIIVDINLDDNLLDYINKNLTSNNIFCFILTNNWHAPVEISKYLICNNQFIDMANEIEIYNNIIMNLPYHIENNEVLNIFKDYISGVLTNQTIELRKIV